MDERKGSSTQVSERCSGSPDSLCLGARSVVLLLPQAHPPCSCPALLYVMSQLSAPQWDMSAYQVQKCKSLAPHNAFLVVY